MMQDIFTLIQKEWKEVVFRREAGRQSWISLVILIEIGGHLPAVYERRRLAAESHRAVHLGVGAAFHDQRHDRGCLRRRARAPHPGNPAGDTSFGYGYPAGQNRCFGAVCLDHLAGVRAGGRHHRQCHVPNRWTAVLSYRMFFGGIVAVLLIAILISSIGVFVSLKASTVRQAYQKLSLSIMAIWFIPFILLQSFPDKMQTLLVRIAPMLDQNLRIF